MAIDLKSLQKNTPKPPRIIIHGEPGVGKTTFGCGAPAPVVVQTEDGLGGLDVTAFPLAASWQDVMESIGAMYQQEHQFKTVIFDSLDWLEPLIWQQVCRDNSVENIEKLGYGKGYVEALSYWRQFFDGANALRDKRGMTVVMTAHSEKKRVEDPLLPAYDTHDLKLHKRAAAIAEEWADVILYAAVQTSTVTEDGGFNQKRVRAVTTGERIAYTVGQPAFLAKNRFALPEKLPLEWGAFAAAMWPKQ